MNGDIWAVCLPTSTKPARTEKTTLPTRNFRIRAILDGGVAVVWVIQGTKVKVGSILNHFPTPGQNHIFIPTLRNLAFFPKWQWQILHFILKAESPSGIILSCCLASYTASAARHLSLAQLALWLTTLQTLFLPPEIYFAALNCISLKYRGQKYYPLYCR